MNSDYCAQCGYAVPKGKQICSSCQNKILKATAPNEDIEQECLLRWTVHIRQKHPEIELLFHIPNGGKRFKKTAKALKRQGVKAGVPDLCLPVPKGGYHGLFIELKKKYEGTARESQEKWLLKLYKQGYATHLCHGWEEAAEVIEKYLNLEGEKMKQEKVLTPEEVEKRLTKEKKKTIALKCINCGRITEEIAKTSDGKLCRKCNSHIVPIGFLKEN